MPFYLSKLSTSEEILDVVVQIREICDDFTSRGLPTYPSGIPFTFWEQYIHLRFYLMLALLCILVVTFIVLSVALVNPVLSGIIVSSLSILILLILLSKSLRWNLMLLSMITLSNYIFFFMTVTCKTSVFWSDNTFLIF